METKQSKGKLSVCWLKVTDYMRGWLRAELDTGRTVDGEPVLALRHLPGGRAALMMETTTDIPAGDKPRGSMSATWHNALEAGMAIDAAAIESEYGVTRETLRQYVPVACPAYAVSQDGIIRPWTDDTCFGGKQSVELLKVLRDAFWRAVRRFSDGYAAEHEGERYPQVQMIEAFCKEYDTDDIYAEAIRREWQRQMKKITDSR